MTQSFLDCAFTGSSPKGSGLCSFMSNCIYNLKLTLVLCGSQRWEDKLEMSGLLIGLVGNICLAFLFFPVSRGSSILQLLGLTSERSIKYHIWLGNAAMTLFTVHGLCYIIFWAKTDQISQVNEGKFMNKFADYGLLEPDHLTPNYDTKRMADSSNIRPELSWFG